MFDFPDPGPACRSSAKNHYRRHYLKFSGQPMTAESGSHKKAKAIPLHKSLAVNHSQMCHHLFRRRVTSSFLGPKSTWPSFIERSTCHTWEYKWWGFVTETAQISDDWLIGLVAGWLGIEFPCRWRQIDSFRGWRTAPPLHRRATFIFIGINFVYVTNTHSSRAQLGSVAVWLCLEN